MLVQMKMASPGMVPAAAATRKVPVLAPAVNTSARAMPFRPVMAVSKRVPLANSPEGEPAGAVKVTGMPGAPLPHWSVTLAPKGMG